MAFNTTRTRCAISFTMEFVALYAALRKLQSKRSAVAAKSARLVEFLEEQQRKERDRFRMVISETIRQVS